MTSVQIDIKDGLSSSTAFKGPVKAATTANITLSGQQTIDGVAIVTDDRVLVKDQTTASDNGIYVADTGSWRRAKDFNNNRDVKTGTMVNVTGGTTNSGIWQVTTSNPITIGSTNLAFARNAQPYDADLASWAAVNRATGVDALVTTPSSANLRALLTDETGTGSAVFGTQPTFTAGAQWSSANYGAALVASGTRNNAIAILDSAGANPWAIANTSGVLRFSAMPALGNTATAPIDGFVLSTAGDAGTGDPLTPPYQVAPIKTKLALSGVYNDGVSGNIFQVSSWVRNSGTAPAVAGFFLGEATGAGSKAWGLNVTAFANNATAVVDAVEIDFASLVAGGFANGALIVYGSALADTAGAYVWCQASDVKSALYGINFNKFGSNPPIQATGTLFKTTGAYTVASGIDISSVTTTTAFKSNGFSVDGTGNVNAAAAFTPTIVGGTGVASTLSLRATTGAGAGSEAIIFQVGNAGGTEAIRVLGAGNIQYTGTANFAANGTVATVLGSLGPTGSHTTVQEWHAFKNSAGVTRWVPCF
ncbi:hypothetical protein [Mesorhizobium sp. Cs1321R2N1]|uniref:hypothetical protein n=1 Tax=Mesorhizobium sp. Cs1321R2N1 TaxID=3015174 RepID=UPI00301BBBFA